MQSGLWRASYGLTKAHDKSVRGIAADGLNQVVVTGGGDAELKFWKFNAKGVEEPLTTVALDESVLFMRSHRESSLIAVGLDDFSVAVVDVDTHALVRKFPGHSAQLTDAAFSADARWLITAAMDCAVRTWDLPTAQLVDQFRTTTACVSLDVSPTGEALATAHVGHLGVFLWSNRALYQRVALRALDAADEPDVVRLPEVAVCDVDNATDDGDDDNDDEGDFKSPEQVSAELITLSGLAASRWQNLLDLDVIRLRNKPKLLRKPPKAAPFFLPTIPSLSLQFDVTTASRDDAHSGASKLRIATVLTNLTNFGRLLNGVTTSTDYERAVEQLMSFGPSMLEYEIKSLCPEEGGSTAVMLHFMKCIERMLTLNRNFELAQAYLAVFLKTHGVLIAQSPELRDYLPTIQRCANSSWSRLQEKLTYNLCVVEHVKHLI